MLACVNFILVHGYALLRTASCRMSLKCALLCRVGRAVPEGVGEGQHTACGLLVNLILPYGR